MLPPRRYSVDLEKVVMLGTPFSLASDSTLISNTMVVCRIIWWEKKPGASLQSSVLFWTWHWIPSKWVILFLFLLFPAPSPSPFWEDSACPTLWDAGVCPSCHSDKGSKWILPCMCTPAEVQGTGVLGVSIFIFKCFGRGMPWAVGISWSEGWVSSIEAVLWIFQAVSYPYAQLLIHVGCWLHFFLSTFPISFCS